jgi:predicted negative regulator of RcsB-dependent stress response
MDFLLNYCIIKPVIYFKREGETKLKKILFVSILTLGILFGGNLLQEESDDNQVAASEEFQFSTTTVTGDPGGGEI